MTSTALALAAAAFVVGYLLGRVELLLLTLRNQPINTPQSFFAKTTGRQAQNGGGSHSAAPIAIDERKIVTDIKTDTLSKTQNIQLGKQVVAADDINASVNKLAQLKRS